MNIQAQTDHLLEATLASLDEQIKELSEYRAKIAEEINLRRMKSHIEENSLDGTNTIDSIVES